MSVAIYEMKLKTKKKQKNTCTQNKSLKLRPQNLESCLNPCCFSMLQNTMAFLKNGLWSLSSPETEQNTLL